MEQTFSQEKLDEIIDSISYLYIGYSRVKRATTQPFHVEFLQQDIASFSYNPKSSLVRESLIEHIGALPIIATALYPYIQDSQVDLGKSLTMLSIHDIGEVITGDEMIFTKQEDPEDKETTAAFTLLHPMYHSLYQEIEGLTSQTGKFAKSIDKIAPDFLDFLTPVAMTIERYKHFVGIEKEAIPELVIKFKRPYMLWNPFLTALHTRLIDRLTEKLRSS